MTTATAARRSPAILTTSAGAGLVAGVFWHRHGHALVLVACVALLLAATFPTLALASVVDDAMSLLTGTAVDLLKNLATEVLKFCTWALTALMDALDVLNDAAGGSVSVYSGGDHWSVALDSYETAYGIDAQFSNLFAQLAVVVLRITQAIKTPAGLIISIIFAVRCLKVLMESDNGPSGIPYLEKFGWILIQYAIFKMLLDYSVNIAVALFDQFQVIATSVSQGMGGYSGTSIDEWSSGLTGAMESNEAYSKAASDATSSDATTHNIEVCTTYIFFLVEWLCITIGFIMLTINAYASVFGRWIQFFIYVGLAPLAFALAGLDETRHVFVNFLKRMVSLSLAFLITIVLVYLAQVICIGMLTANITSPEITADNIKSLVVVIACGTMCNIGIKQAGEWSKEIVG